MKCSAAANKIKEILKKNGYKAYIVGGAVRDYVLKRTINDYDIATNALPNDIIKIFSNYPVIKTGMKHGTVAVIVRKEKVEVTTFRKDGDYDDYRHPLNVEFVEDLYSDLKRRDFTINSLAYDDEIIDYFGGISDIKNSIIRTINDPYKSFTDDALRILRALRFASVLGFSISDETKEAIHKYASLLERISKERIIDELFKMIVGKYYYMVFCDYFDVFQYLFNLNYSNDEKEKTIIGYKKMTSDDLLLRLGLLFFYSDEEKICDLLKKYRLSKANIKNISKICSLKSRRCSTEIDIRRLLKTYDYMIIEKYFYLQSILDEDFNYDNKISILIDVKNKCNSLSDLLISGNDLLKIGIENKKIGELLDSVLDEVIDGKLENEKEKLLDYVKKRVNIC